jgi:hypothetical protein
MGTHEHAQTQTHADNMHTTHTRKHAYTQVNIYTCTHAHMHTCTHAHMHTDTQTCTHVRHTHSHTVHTSRDGDNTNSTPDKHTCAGVQTTGNSQPQRPTHSHTKAQRVRHRRRQRRRRWPRRGPPPTLRPWLLLQYVSVHRCKEAGGGCPACTRGAGGMFTVGGLTFRADFDSANLGGVELLPDGTFALSISPDGKGASNKDKAAGSSAFV